MDQVVEVVEGGIGGKRGGKRRRGDDERVDAERVQGIETGGDGFVVGALLEPELFGGASAGWVGGTGGDLIEDGLTPPEVGVEAGTWLAGAGEGLRGSGEGG